jgi:plastocyanin
MSWFWRMVLPFAPLTTFTLVWGCGGDDGGTPPSTTTITKTSTDNGDGQTGIVGQPLALPLRVLVTESGSPVAGATVTWSTQTEGGSLNPASTPTGPDGIASTSWTLGNFAVQQSAQATLSGASGSPLIFTAQGQPDAASALTKESADGQSGEINTVLSGAFQVKVSDQFGNGIPAFPVSWSATNATVSAMTVPTSVSGVSQVDVTLGGTVGPVTVTATAEGLLGSPATFTAAAIEPTGIPTAATVRVGNDLFASTRNATVNPAVDTVAVGGTVTWNWVNTGSIPHNVQSSGSPSFPSSEVLTGNGQSYAFTFGTAGTYQYTCIVHPGLMTGRVIVR